MPVDFGNDALLQSAYGEALDFEPLDPGLFQQFARTAKVESPRALLGLGRRLLAGNGVDANPQEGVALVSAAAERGLPEALNLMATLTAAGAWTEQSWPHCLDLLQAAAEGGSRDAREQILILTSDKAAAAFARGGLRDKKQWQRLRESIDLEAYVRPPERQQVCDEPRIWRADGFASPELCQRAIERSRGKLHPAKMYDRAEKTARLNAVRDNSDYLVDIIHSGVTLVLMRIKIGLLVSLPVPHMEPPQILHYAPGQQFRAHYDFLRNGDTPIAGGYEGDRVVTFLLYLNDDYEGGETEFVKAGYRCKGRTGDAIFFANLRGGKPDAMSLHSGTPVTSGEKWLFSQWIHDRPFTA